MTSLMRRPFDLIMAIYFVIHIPTTILVDSQSVVPRQYFPRWATDALDWHIKVNQDHLVSSNPAWFVSLVACEVLLQLPFFFVATYAFIKELKWIRVPALIYGVHVATTLIPILTDILAGPQGGLHKWPLAAIYVPYFLVPVALAARMAVMPDPFPKRKRKVA